MTQAEDLAARFPPLMVAAERVAATVAQGVHGRRRVGVGDSFWQYRPFVEGDAAARIDWRRSARSDREFVRDMEWEAAQTVCLWRDASPSMDWHSARALPTKRARAELLLLALAALLFRAGELVRVLGLPRIFRGRLATTSVAAALPLQAGAAPDAGAALPSHARAVLFGDFLAEPAALRATLSRFSERRVRGHLVQVLDPAEIALPYAGRVRFTGLEGEASALVSRVEGIRAEYAAALQAQLDAVRGIAAAAGFGHLLHVTDRPPETALLALHQALAEPRR